MVLQYQSKVMANLMTRQEALTLEPQWLRMMMLRMRKRFTEMLERKHTETMRKYSQFQTAEDENDAYEMWRERRERESKRRKVEPQQHRMPCPACAAHGW